MSSQTDRTYDASAPSPYAPRWVRHATQRPRRIQTIGEGRSTLRDNDLRATEPLAAQRHEHTAPPLAARHPEGDEDLVIDDFRVPRSLDPGTVPDPWPASRSRIRTGVFGMFGRLALAVAIAGVGAFIAVGKLSVSLPDASGASDQPQPKTAVASRFDFPAPAAPDTKAPETKTISESVASETQARPSQPIMTTPAAPQPELPPMKVATATPTLPAAAAAPSNPVIASPPAVPAPAAPPVVASAVDAPPGLDPNSEEVASLVKRGEGLATAGDIAAARLMLRRAAESHNARAALALAATYDPLVLKKIGAFGVSPDVATARRWYEKAQEYGSAEAPRRLELLASRGQ